MTTRKKTGPHDNRLLPRLILGWLKAALLDHRELLPALAVPISLALRPVKRQFRTVVPSHTIWYDVPAKATQALG